MANLDTRSKRASSVAIMFASVLAPPLPDAALDQGDRQHVAFSYSGIEAAAPDIDGPPYHITGSLDPVVYLFGSLEPSLTMTGSL